METGIDTIKKLLSAKNIDGLIVTNPYNILYLTGFQGISPTEREATLTVTKDHATLITARLYQKEAQKVSSKNLKIKIANERNEIDKFIESSLINATSVGFEEADLKYSEFLKYKKLLTPAKLVGQKNLIEDLRIVKSEDEISKIEKAQLITQKTFTQIIKTLKLGETEAEIAHKMASILRSLDAQGQAFEAIVASGPNSGKPHHVTGNRKIKNGDTLLFDFGAKYQNYCADFSRTVFIGKASDTQRNIYSHVLTAQKKALDKIKHGIKNHEPYHAANNHFKKNRLEKYFTHGLGHGIGLEVHELPYLRTKINTKRLTNQMVFSVEPGLYFNWGGVRLEDLVTIKNGGLKILGKLIDKIIEI